MAQLTFKRTQPIRILKNSRGQTLVEYGLLLILIAVVIISAITIVGRITNNTYSTVGSALPEP